MKNRNLKRGLLLLVPIIFAITLVFGREWRKFALTQEFIRATQTKIDFYALENLISQGADVNGIIPHWNSSNAGETALHLATRQHYGGGLMRFLLDKGANINAKNDWGWTPLMTASESGYHSSVQFLIENGADLNVESPPQIFEDELVKKKRTALNLAVVAAKSKRAKTYGLEPQLKETIRILKAAGAKE